MKCAAGIQGPWEKIKLRIHLASWTTVTSQPSALERGEDRLAVEGEKTSLYLDPRALP